MTEGPFSTTSYELAPGSPGCETNLLDYASGSGARVWPTWQSMKNNPFKIEFDLPYDLNWMPAKQEVFVRLFEKTWLMKLAHTQFSFANSCPVQKNFDQEKMICVNGIHMKYMENDGYVRYHAQGDK